MLGNMSHGEAVGHIMQQGVEDVMEQRESLEHTIQIVAHVGQKELFEFNMVNTYKSLKGIVGILFSVCSGIGLVVYWNDFNNWQRGLLLLFALMFVVIVPVEYVFRAKKQAKKSFVKPFTYTFGGEGIEICLDDAKAVNRWTDIMKVTTSKKLVYIYLSPVRAYLLPKADIGEKYEELKKMLKTNTSCYKFKM